MDHVVHRVLRFECFALDIARGCLRTGDREFHLRPKTFDVLCYLAQNAGRLVSKQELFETVWLGVGKLEYAAGSGPVPLGLRLCDQA